MFMDVIALSFCLVLTKQLANRGTLKYILVRLKLGLSINGFSNKFFC